MTRSMVSRGNHNDHHARPEGPVSCGGTAPTPPLGASPRTPSSGRRGARVENVTRMARERPVDTIAVARNLAEVQA